MDRLEIVKLIVWMMVRISDDGLQMVASAIAVVILHIGPPVVAVVNLQEARDMLVMRLMVLRLVMVLRWVMGMVTTYLEDHSGKYL